MTSQVCQNFMQSVSLLLLFMFQFRNKGDLSPSLSPHSQAKAEHTDCYIALRLTAAQKNQVDFYDMSLILM